MELKEFVEETKRLTDYFDKDYNEIQAKEIYNRLKDISVEHYRRIINKLIDTEERLPKVNKIIYYKELTYGHEESKKEEGFKQVHCDNCLGSGLISFTQEKNGCIYEYQARCNCENAKQYDSWLDKDGFNLFPSAEELNLI